LIAERLRKLALRVPAIRPFFEAGRTLRGGLYPFADLRRRLRVAAPPLAPDGT